MRVIFSVLDNPIGRMSGPYIITFASPIKLPQHPELIEHDEQHLYLGVTADAGVCEIIAKNDKGWLELGLLLPCLKLPPNEVRHHIAVQLASLEQWDESFTSEVLIAVLELYGYETFCNLCR